MQPNNNNYPNLHAYNNYENQNFNNYYTQPQSGWNANTNNHNNQVNYPGGNDGYGNNNYGGGFHGNMQQVNHNKGQGFNNAQYANNNMNNGFTIPDQFIIKQKLLTIGMDMKLEKNGQKFGFIKEKMLSFGKTFQMQDNNGKVIAKAKEKLLTIGRDFQIVDASGNKIGSIIQEVLKSMMSIHRKYTVRNANGAIVGSTKQLQILSKAGVEILNSYGSTQAKFSESWTSFIKQKWNVKFYGNNIDRRLLIFFPSISSERQQSKTLK